MQSAEILELRRIRRYLGDTQLEVALAIGVTHRRYSLAESGRVQLSSGEIAAIREYFAQRLRCIHGGDHARPKELLAERV